MRNYDRDGLGACGERIERKGALERYKTMSYLFYISYARENNIDGLVSKFYEDLRKDIAGKMAARPDEVGFFDAGEKEPWVTEFSKRASAVRQSNVFIAIYSPYYFQRKFCGMEWTVFSSRVEAYAKSLPGGFALPALMIPVLWQNEREVSPHIPTALTGLQYKYHALGKTYAEQGLRVMLRNKRFRKEYKDFIPVLADLVIEAARRHKLPDLPNLPAFKEIMPAFPVDETLPSPVIEKVESGLSDTQTYDLSPTIQFVPLHDAYERIVNFARRFGEPHVALAMHAALPIGLTPELVHLIRVNFVNRAPMIAEADLLLSPLCREVGGGLYEMYPEVRELLLAELNEDEEIPDNRIEELAEFLMVYATRNLRSARFPELRNFLVAQQWTALARLRPAETAQSLASALGKRLSAQNPAGSLRLAQLARSMSAQLAGQDNVLVYAAASRAWLSAMSKGVGDVRHPRFNESIPGRQINHAARAGRFGAVVARVGGGLVGGGLVGGGRVGGNTNRAAPTARSREASRKDFRGRHAYYTGGVVAGRRTDNRRFNRGRIEIMGYENRKVAEFVRRNPTGSERYCVVAGRKAYRDRFVRQ